jgi:tetratricopeptide (TPR) repeat protein
MIRPRVAFSSLMIFILCTHVFSQGYKGQGRFSGTVSDKDGNPLEGVKVRLFCVKGRSGFEATTDKEGKWRANYVRGGIWDLDFEKSGYMPKKLSVDVKEFDRNKLIEIQMEKIEGLVITEELRGALKEGNTLYEDKKFKEAAAAYIAIIQANPDAYYVAINIGNCYFQMQEYTQAEEYYKKILEKDPQNAEAMLLIGNCYANRGLAEQAMEWYDKIEFEKITDPMVLFNIGSKFYSQSKFEQALKYYKRALEIQSDFLDAIYQLGMTYLALNRSPEAIAAFEKYLKHDSSSEKASQVKGFLEFLKKK